MAKNHEANELLNRAIGLLQVSVGHNRLMRVPIWRDVYSLW